jgi:LysM repeat protein
VEWAQGQFLEITLTIDTKPTLTTFRLAATQVGLRIIAYGLALSLVVSTVWLAGTDWGYAKPPAVPTPAPSLTPAAQPVTGGPQALPAPLLVSASNGGVVRLAEPHTTVPTRPDYNVKQYTVEAKDTLFVIADKFKLKPETILWGNPELSQNPNILSTGKSINILPVDGALRVVMKGDTLEKIAKYFHGKIQDIISFPGNDLDPNNPQLHEGQMIVIPGGWRDQVVWALPAPPQGRATTGRGWSTEPGACPGPFEGATGSGAFVWPTNNHYLSGWDFKSDHPGIDIAAKTGNPIFAADSGVIVFAGVSTWGYGNLIIIDHGNGFQSAYGHLSQINVVCGQSVFQGNLIGLAGNTGNSFGAHLHFEIRSNSGGRVNPWSYLP